MSHPHENMQSHFLTHVGVSPCDVLSRLFCANGLLLDVVCWGLGVCMYVCVGGEGISMCAISLSSLLTCPALTRLNLTIQCSYQAHVCSVVPFCRIPTLPGVNLPAHLINPTENPLKSHPSASDAELFGNFSKSFFTMFQCTTGDGWATDVARPMFYKEGVEYHPGSLSIHSPSLFSRPLLFFCAPFTLPSLSLLSPFSRPSLLPNP